MFRSECHCEWLQHAQDLEEWCPCSAIAEDDAILTIAFCADKTLMCVDGDKLLTVEVVDKHSLNQA